MCEEKKQKAENQPRDNILLPVAINAITRSILFCAEAGFIKDKLLSAIAAHNAMYNLSLFIACVVDVDDIPAEPRALKNGKNFNGLSRTELNRLLKRCTDKGLPQPVIESFHQLDILKGFIHQGFPMFFSRNGIRVERFRGVDGVHEKIVSGLSKRLAETILWACKKSPENNLLVSFALKQAAVFFKKGDFYAAWCAPNVLKKAEFLRMKLRMYVRSCF